MFFSEREKKRKEIIALQTNDFIVPFYCKVLYTSKFELHAKKYLIKDLVRATESFNMKKKSPKDACRLARPVLAIEAFSHTAFREVSVGNGFQWPLR